MRGGAGWQGQSDKHAVRREYFLVWRAGQFELVRRQEHDVLLCGISPGHCPDRRGQVRVSVPEQEYF